MKNIKFVVKVTRGKLAPTFVQRVDPPVQMTTNRKLALIMRARLEELRITEPGSEDPLQKDARGSYLSVVYPVRRFEPSPHSTRH